MKKIVLAYSGGLDTSYCLKKLSNEEKVKSINVYRKKMEAAAKSLDFIEAARLRDIIKELKK